MIEIKDVLTEEHNSNGEAPDGHVLRALRLAHLAVQKFSEFENRHQKFIGSKKIIGVTAIIAGAFVINRIFSERPGISDDEVLEGVKHEDLINAEKEVCKREKPERISIFNSHSH